MTNEIIPQIGSGENFSDDERRRMTEELKSIMDGEQEIVAYDTDNLISFENEAERGKTVSDYVSSPIRRAVKNRQEAAEEAEAAKAAKKAEETKETRKAEKTEKTEKTEEAVDEVDEAEEGESVKRLDPKQVRNKNRRQALAIAGSVVERSMKRVKEVDIASLALVDLHKRTTLPANGKEQSITEMLFQEDRQGPLRLESLGRFAWELDKTKKDKGDEARFVELLNASLDNEDEDTLKLFVAAARTNTAVRSRKYHRQIWEFKTWADIRRGVLQYKDAYPELPRGDDSAKIQAAYIKTRTGHADGPATYQTTGETSQRI